MGEGRLTIVDRIIQRVSTETNTDPLDLPPLYETIEPDALEACIRGMADGEVSFTYAGTAVAVDSDGSIRVTTTPPTAQPAEKSE